MKPHKFVITNNAPSHYAIVVACEWCGLKASDSNRGDVAEIFMRNYYGKDCPNAPEKVEEKK